MQPPTNAWHLPTRRLLARRAVDRFAQQIGVTVVPGDIIVADADGAVVIPQALLDAVVVSSAVGAAKPEALPLQRALQLLELEPEQVWRVY